MVDTDIREHVRLHPGHGHKHRRNRNGRPAIEVRFPQWLFDKIVAEAETRQWSTAHMIRFLCEASIDGIE